MKRLMKFGDSILLMGIVIFIFLQKKSHVKIVRIKTKPPIVIASCSISNNPFIKMLLHVFNHGTYHRGQLINMLRQLFRKMYESSCTLFLQKDHNLN